MLALKARVNALAPGERLLVYRPCAKPETRGDWLADVELFAQGFSADGTSMLLRELGAADGEEMRTAAARCERFLRKASARRRVRALAGARGIRDARELDLAVMLSALGERGAATAGRRGAALPGGAATLDPAATLASFLAACDGDEASAWALLAKAGADGRFSEMLRALAGIKGAGKQGAEGECVGAQVLRRALSWQLRTEGGVEPHDEFCYRVLVAWRARASRTALSDVCELAFGDRLRLSVDEALLQDVCWQAEEAIVDHLLRAVASLSCDVAHVISVVDARKSSYWYEDFECYYQVVACAARMREFRDAHADALDGRAVDLWASYQRDLFRMDQLYRHLRRAASPCIVYALGSLDEPLRAALAWAEGLYKGWYLRRLGDAWSDATADDYRELGYVRGIDRSDSFYALQVQGLRGRSSCATVIISDALRYEVAVELADRLAREARGTVELSAQTAPFPSITPVGMAALLPHVRLRLADDCHDVLVDGVSSAGLARRQEILRDPSHLGVAGAVTLSSADFLQMSAKERKGLGRAAGLVYLYHNVIDETGESDEDALPAACDDAIDQLVGLVRACSTAFGPNVVVTADHGFVYTATELDSLDKVNKAEVAGEVVCATHRRAVLARAGATSDALMPVSLAAVGRSDLVGFTPRGYLRVQQPGAGDRFVHGGTSLQEVCVPVLRFHARRGRAAGHEGPSVATVCLLGTNRVVSDFQPVVAFHQDCAVGGEVLPAVYTARFETDGGAPLSDEVELHADRPSVDGEAGTIRARFSIALAGVARETASPGEGTGTGADALARPGVGAETGMGAAERPSAGGALPPVGYLTVREARTGEVALRERFTLGVPTAAWKARPAW